MKQRTYIVVVVLILSNLNLFASLPTNSGIVVRKQVLLREIYGRNYTNEIAAMRTQFDQGELTNVDYLRLLDETNTEVPASVYSESTYFDGSIKQASVYFLANLSANQLKTYMLDIDDTRPAPAYSTDINKTDVSSTRIRLENSYLALGVANSSSHGIKYIYWKSASKNATEASSNYRLPWTLLYRSNGSQEFTMAWSKQAWVQSPIVSKLSYRLENSTYNMRLECEIWVFSQQKYFLVQATLSYYGKSTTSEIVQLETSFRWDISDFTTFYNDTAFPNRGWYSSSENVGVLATPTVVSSWYDFYAQTGAGSQSPYAHWNIFQTTAWRFRNSSLYPLEKWTASYYVYLHDAGSSKNVVETGAQTATRRMRAFAVKDIGNVLSPYETFKENSANYFETRYSYNLASTEAQKAHPYTTEGGSWFNEFPEDLYNHIPDAMFRAIQQKNMSLLNRVISICDELATFYSSLKPWTTSIINPQLQGSYLACAIAEAYLNLKDYNGQDKIEWKKLAVDLAVFISTYVSDSDDFVRVAGSKSSWIFNMDAIASKAIYFGYMLSDNATLRAKALDMWELCETLFKEPLTFGYGIDTGEIAHEQHYTMWVMHELGELALRMDESESWRPRLVNWCVRSFYFWSRFNNGTFFSPADLDMETFPSVFDLETWLMLLASLYALGYVEVVDNVDMSLSYAANYQNTNGSIGEYGQLGDWVQSEGYVFSTSYATQGIRLQKYNFGRLWYYALYFNNRSNPPAKLYSLTVNVTVNLQPIRDVAVEVSGYGVKMTDVNGTASWQLPYGTYEINAHWKNSTKTMTVQVNNDMIVDFNFVDDQQTVPSPNFIILILLLLGAAILAAAFCIYLARKRR